MSGQLICLQQAQVKQINYVLKQNSIDEIWISYPYVYTISTQYISTPNNMRYWKSIHSLQRGQPPPPPLLVNHPFLEFC